MLKQKIFSFFLVSMFKARKLCEAHPRSPLPSLSPLSPSSLDDSLRSVSSVLINCGRCRDGRHMVHTFRLNFPNVLVFYFRILPRTVLLTPLRELCFQPIMRPFDMTVNDPGVPRRRAARSLFRRERARPPAPVSCPRW